MEKGISFENKKSFAGIGKSYVLQLFKNKLMKEKQHILCSTYTFSGDKVDDIKVIKKIIFQLFFPYLYFEDLDSDYAVSYTHLTLPTT